MFVFFLSLVMHFGTQSPTFALFSKKIVIQKKKKKISLIHVPTVLEKRTDFLVIVIWLKQP